MKPTFSLLARVALVLAGLVVFLTHADGQALTIFHNFQDGSVANDGAQISSGLIYGTDGNLYGSTYNGGDSGSEGCVFNITPAGVVTILHSFGDGSIANDGNHSRNTLLQASDGNFYGVATFGGVNNSGVVFKVTLQGVTSVLHYFTDGSVANDGAFPDSNLVEGSDGNFYGTTDAGGTASAGTIYKMTPAGGVTILHNFGDGSVTGDGSNPQGGLILAADGNFYGTVSQGGTASSGTFIRMTPAGVVTVLHTFNDGSVANDAVTPLRGLVQSGDGNFYGTSQQGGASGSGAVFKITPQGAVTILHSFDDGTVANDGTAPNGALMQAKDGNFYGTAFTGGNGTQGVVFRITPQGVYSILHHFEDGSVTQDGGGPEGILAQASDGSLYGTAIAGGNSASNGQGVVYRLVLTTSNLTSPVTATGSVSLPFSYQITGTNTPTSFTAAPLPDGLSINANGLITGTPTTPGTTNTVLTLTNSSGSSSYPLTITINPLPVPAVTSILTAYATVGTPFTYKTIAINAPTGYGASGLDPISLSIDGNTGIITGTPSQVGTFTVNLTASNSAGSSSAVMLVIQVFATPPMISQEYNLMHNFADGSVISDAFLPNSILQAFDGNFYGSALDGGASGFGAIFEMTVQGTSSVLYSFPSNDSAPTSLLQGADGNFYGTTSGIDQIFKVSASGQFTALHTFGAAGASNNFLTLNRLTQGSDGSFYGTTYNAQSNLAE